MSAAGALTRTRLRRAPEPLLVGLVCLLAVMLASALLRKESVITGDARFYERIAAHPAGPHNYPYAYRIGVPYLVHVLPFSHVTSFTILAWLAIAGAGAAMYALLREFEIGARFAAALSLGFVLSPNLLVSLLRNGRSVDPAMTVLVVLGTLFIVRRQRVALMLTVLAGTTVHELCLFLIPLCYAVWAERPFDPRAARETAAVCALPVLAYVAIRTTIASAGVSLNGQPFFSTRIHALKLGLEAAGSEVRRVGLAFGPLWLAAPCALPRLSFARRGLILFVLCLGGLTFALDWGRVVFVTAPVMYVAAAFVAQSRRQVAIALVVALFAVDAGYAIYMQAYGVTHGLDAPGSTNAITLY